MKLVVLQKLVFLAIVGFSTTSVVQASQVKSPEIARAEAGLCQEYVSRYDRARKDLESSEIFINDIIDASTIAEMNKGIQREIKTVEEKILAYFREFANLPFLDRLKESAGQIATPGNSDKVPVDLERVRSEIFSWLYNFDYQDSATLDPFQQQIFKGQADNEINLIIDNMRSLKPIVVNGKPQRANAFVNEKGKSYNINVEGFSASEFFTQPTWNPDKVIVTPNGFSVELIFLVRLDYAHSVKAKAYRRSQYDQIKEKESKSDNFSRKLRQNEQMAQVLEKLPVLKAPHIPVDFLLTHKIRYEVSFQDQGSAELQIKVDLARDLETELLNLEKGRNKVSHIKGIYDLHPSQQLRHWLLNYLSENGFEDSYKYCKGLSSQ